jgi:lysozyme
MNLSAEGRAKIEGYEGYHARLPDGGCKAYQETFHGKKDKWTIGYGCTEGVYEGLVWTKEQSDAAFERELSKFESAVNRLVTVPLNQNQFDALVSFSYNCGIGALQSSSLLKKLNKGDYDGAAGQFQFWNHAGGGVVAGLTQRRASEASLFRKPVEPLPLPSMPQTVEKRTEPPSAGAAATGTAATGGFIYTMWQSVGDKFNSFFDGLDEDQVLGFMGNAQKHGVLSGVHPLKVVGAVAFCAALYFIVCHWLPSFTGKNE